MIIIIYNCCKYYKNCNNNYDNYVDNYDDENVCPHESLGLTDR